MGNSALDTALVARLQKPKGFCGCVPSTAIATHKEGVLTKRAGKRDVKCAAALTPCLGLDPPLSLGVRTCQFCALNCQVWGTIPVNVIMHYHQICSSALYTPVTLLFLSTLQDFSHISSEFQNSVGPRSPGASNPPGGTEWDSDYPSRECGVNHCRPVDKTAPCSCTSGLGQGQCPTALCLP